MQADAARRDLDGTVSALQQQLQLERQAHAQAQQREAAASKSCQDMAMQLQMRVQDVQALSSELQQSRGSQHDSELHTERLQQQLDAASSQRYASRLL